MKLHFNIYANTNDFLEDNLAWLEKEEAINSLMIGLVVSMKDRTLTDKEFLIQVKNDEEIVLLSIQSNYNIILAGDQNLPLEIIKDFAIFLKNQGIKVPGVLGYNSLSKHFEIAYSALFKLQYKINFEQCILELRDVLPYGECEGRLRIADENDKDLLNSWMYDFQIEALNDTDSAKAKKTVEIKLKNSEFYLWIVNKKPVCLTAKARPTRNGITINYVYTPKEFRGRGYATNLVGQVSRIQLNEGFKFCTLFTDKSNPTSNKIYTGLGYEFVGHFSEINFYS